MTNAFINVQLTFSILKKVFKTTPSTCSEKYPQPNTTPRVAFSKWSAKLDSEPCGPSFHEVSPYCLMFAPLCDAWEFI